MFSCASRRTVTPCHNFKLNPRRVGAVSSLSTPTRLLSHALPIHTPLVAVTLSSILIWGGCEVANSSSEQVTNQPTETMLVVIKQLGGCSMQSTHIMQAKNVSQKT